MNAVKGQRRDIVYALIDQNNTFDFSRIDDEVLKRMYVIDVLKEKRREDIACGLDTERIYIFSGDRAILSKVKHFRMNKLLQCMGIYVYTKKMRRARRDDF